MSNFIWPDDLTTLPPEVCREWLTHIRTRRARIGDKIERLKKLTNRLTAGAVRDKVEKELLKFKKLLNRADELMTEAENRLNNVVGLQLQLDDADRPPLQLAKGCCSSVIPCAHQKLSPYTICEICKKAQEIAA
jgi:hypothetical protein